MAVLLYSLALLVLVVGLLLGTPYFAGILLRQLYEKADQEVSKRRYLTAWAAAASVLPVTALSYFLIYRLLNDVLLIRNDFTGNYWKVDYAPYFYYLSGYLLAFLSVVVLSKLVSRALGVKFKLAIHTVARVLEISLLLTLPIVWLLPGE